MATGFGFSRSPRSSPSCATHPRPLQNARLPSFCDPPCAVGVSGGLPHLVHGHRSPPWPGSNPASHRHPRALTLSAIFRQAARSTATPFGRHPRVIPAPVEPAVSFLPACSIEIGRWTPSPAVRHKGRSKKMLAILQTAINMQGGVVRRSPSCAVVRRRELPGPGRWCHPADTAAIGSTMPILRSGPHDESGRVPVPSERGACKEGAGRVPGSAGDSLPAPRWRHARRGSPAYRLGHGGGQGRSGRFRRTSAGVADL